jgi:hypothetical protein
VKKNSHLENNPQKKIFIVDNSGVMGHNYHISEKPLFCERENAWLDC